MNVTELAGPSIDMLRPASRPDPRPARGEALIRLRAGSLNFLDVAIATGRYPGIGFPIVPVADGAGEIVELGGDVGGWAIGDRVIPHFMPDWPGGAMTPAMFAARRGVTVQGSLADFALVPAASLVAIPAHLGYAQAATLPIAATTAWRAVRTARLGPHSTALLLGTGGVSIFALQFAKAHGARVIVTSSSDAKLERAQALGADLTINYRSIPAWDVEVMRLTDGLGADLVLETGGTATFPLSVRSASMGGTVFVIGFLSGASPTIDVLPIMERQLRIQGNNTGPVADLRDAAAAIAAHGIVPVIDRTFPFRDAAEAYRLLADGGGHFGKIALEGE
ncbi:MAG: NAD(P)-dependent alcohol dehydrogenase [Xanthobacteraceae bacterium]|nr:NAD(P)-dependent alcohol dehydrogenase [Xanthobacteraceae bacterium]